MLPSSATLSLKIAGCASTPGKSSSFRSSCPLPSPYTNRNLSKRKPIKAASTITEKVQHNIQVFIRIRPKDSTEELKINFLESPPNTIQAELVDSNPKPQIFQFDGILGEQTSQEEVYKVVGAPLVEEFIQGYNASIFCYGHTGSGKTYTMGTNVEGMEVFRDGKLHESCGLLPRIIESVLAKKKSDEILSCSLLEVYNKQVNDLLGNKIIKKIVMTDENNMGVKSQKIRIESLDQFKFISQALKKRHQQATGRNHSSSRSHCIFTLYISSKLNERCLIMVDLAGSERQKSSNMGSDNDLLKEATEINLSLSALNTCINRLHSFQVDPNIVIPFRDHPLTKLVSPAFGGNSKTFFIGNIGCYKESMDTLNHVQVARKIKNASWKLQYKKQSGGMFKEEIDHLKKSLEEIMSKLDESRQEKDTKTRHIEILSQQIEIFEKKQEEARSSMEEAKNLYHSLKIQLDSYRETSKEKDERINDLYKSLDYSTECKQVLESENSKLFDENQQLKIEISLLKERLEQNTPQEDKENKSIQSLQEKLKEKNKQIKKLKSNCYVKRVEELEKEKDKLIFTLEEQKKTTSRVIDGMIPVVDVEKDEIMLSPISSKRKSISPLKDIVYENEDIEPGSKCTKL